jgi:hypothetical protein
LFTIRRADKINYSIEHFLSFTPNINPFSLGFIPKLFDFRAQEHTIYTNHKELDYDALLHNIYEMPISETAICRSFGIRIHSFRGKFLIHASKNIDKERSESLGIGHNELSCRAIIGSAVLYYIKQYKNKTELEIDKDKHYAEIKKFSFCRYGFMIKNPHRLKRSIPYPGKLKFFEVGYPASF